MSASDERDRALRPPAFVQVDIDGLWAVRRCYGRKVRDTFERDPCWSEGVPNLLELFGELKLPASFFVVGRDLRVPEKRALAHRIAEAGHEVGNHSWRHRIGMTELGFGAILHDIRRAHEAIVRSGLPAPVGFRAPGYDVDVRVLRALRRLGYKYDASLLPTRIGPLLRAADAWLALRWQPGKRQFGRLAYATCPRGPYFPQVHRLRKKAPVIAESRLMELPVGTLTRLRLPLTASAIFALGPRRVIQLLETERRSARPILLLLHTIDLTDTSRRIVFDWRRPSAGGFNLSVEEKRARILPVLDYVRKAWNPVRADDWVERYFHP